MKAQYRSDQNWEKYGQLDPYYGVLSSNKYRKENLDEETLSAFFQSGKKHIEQILALADRSTDMHFRREAALDFGCGVGRLVLPLAEHFKQVVGVDISPSMLIEAEFNCEKHEIGNIDFVLSDDELSRVAGTFDFIHSAIVLQHIPVKRGEKIFRRLIELLAPDGVAALEVPFARDIELMRRFKHLRRFALVREVINWSRRNIPPVHMLANLVQGRPVKEPVMEMNEYSLTKLLLILNRHGIRKVSVQMTNHDGQIGAFLVFQKTGAPATGVAVTSERHGQIE